MHRNEVLSTHMISDIIFFSSGKSQRIPSMLASILFFLILMVSKSNSQLSTELSNTVLKIHSLKAETERCYEKFKVM